MLTQIINSKLLNSELYIRLIKKALNALLVLHGKSIMGKAVPYKIIKP